MKAILLFSISVLMSFSALAIKNFAPNSSNAVTGGATYCQSATAGAIVFTYNTCSSGVGGSTGVAITINWYKTSTNGTSGGTVVSTTSGTCSTSGTGTASYTPSTSAIGVAYYYCTITWAGSGTCRGTGTLTSATAARVEVNGVPGTISGATSFCTGVPATLSNAAADGTWTSSDVTIASVNPSTGAVNGVAAGSATITYSTGCGTDATSSITVNTSPASITGTTTVCTGSNVTLADAVSSGVWSSGNNSLATVDASTGIVSGVSAGSVPISYAIGSCVAATTVSVNTTPSPSISGSTLIVCQDAVLTLSGSPAGGTWSSSDITTATIDAATGDVTGIVSGNVTISYMATNSCGTGYGTNMVTVYPLPVVDTISGITNVCPGATTTLADTTMSGVWTCDNTSIATVDATGIVTGIATGSANIYYTLTTMCGMDYGVTPITVNVVTVAGPISGTLTVCTGSTTTLTNTIAGGTWSSSDNTLATVDPSTGVVTALAAGTPDITYTYIDICGTTFTTATLNITTTPTTLPSISGANIICMGATNTYTNSMAGGTWSSSDVTIATIDAATGAATSVAVGTATISYTFTNACGTANTTKAITVNVAPAAPAAISGSTTVCTGTTTTLTDTTTGGNWNSSDNTIASIDASGLVTGIATGTVTITYTVSNTCGFENTTSSITVNTAPGTPASITGTTTFCQGTTSTLSNTTAGGAWATSDASVASVDASGTVTGIATGIATISYTVSNACGSTYSAQDVTITGAPSTPAGISGATIVCNAATTTLTDATAGGTWSSSDNTIAAVDAAGVVSGVAAGSVNITYTVTNSCGSANVTSPMTVNAAPSAPAAISGATTLCAAATTTLTDASAGGSWSSSDGTVATIDGTGIVTGVAAGAANITYTVSNACGSANITSPITINSAPAAPATISGSTSVCAGSNTELTDATVSGTWSSSNTAIATVDASGIVTGVTAGAANITYTVTGACGTAFALQGVTVLNTPAAPASITGTTTFCAYTTTTLSDATTGGTWSSSNTSLATVNASSGVVTGIAPGSPVISYTMSNACGSSFATRTVTVNNGPSPISGATNVCTGSSTTLTNAVSGGTWTRTNGTGRANIGAATGIVSGINAGTVAIKYTIGSCNATLNMTVNQTPAAITGTNTVCEGAVRTYANTVSGGTWSSSDATIATVDPSSGDITGVSAGTATITYTIGSCYTTRAITVHISPAAISGSTSVCTGTTTTLTNSVSGGTWSRTNGTGTANIGSSTGIVTGTAAGTVTIKYTIGSCVATLGMTVDQSPATITGTNTVCEGATRTYADAVSGGVWSTSNTTMATVDASSGVISAVSAGSAVITYSIASCYATRGITINVSPAAISGSSTVCSGTTTTLTNSVSGGNWSRTNGTGTANIGASTGIVTGGTAGTVTISYTIGSCRSTMGMTVNQSPVAITGTNTVCQGLTTTYANTVHGGAWSSSNTSLATVDTAGVISGISAGTATITYTIGSCFSTRNVTVKASPTAITGANVVCAGGTTTLTDTTSGGNWTRTNGTGTANIAGATGIVSGLTAGTVTITYTKASCRATLNMTVLGTPAAITGATAICSGNTTSLANTTANGTWTSSNTTVASIDPVSGSLTGLTAGTSTVTYSTGCGSSATSVETVNATPSAISGSSSVCEAASITLFDAINGGTWSSSNTATATVDATRGIVTGISAGSVTITYMIGSCYVTFPVTVNPLPNAGSITGVTTVCQDASSTVADGVTGGVWSSANTGIAFIDVSGSVSGVSAGTTTISYTVTNGCGAIAATAPFTVNALPTASISSEGAPCYGYSTNVLFSGTTGATITYSVDSGTATSATLAGGSYTLSTGTISSAHNYTLIDVTSAGCNTSIDNTITVAPIQMQWMGGATGHETEWGNASNWSCGTVPSVTDNIVIAATAYSLTVPSGATAQANNLTIQSGATVALSSGSHFDVKGTLTNNGAFTGAGSVRLNNSTAQSINGIGSISNLELNNSAGATISHASSVVINNTLTVTSGILVTNDSLVLGSDSVATANVAPIPASGASISGNVKVMQYIPGGFRRYRFWCHPFSNSIALSQIENYIDVTGQGGATNGFTTTGTNSPSAIRYNPLISNSAAASDPGWKAFTSAYGTGDSNMLHQFQGIRLFIRGAKGEGLDGAAYTPSATNISMIGNLNQGSKVITLAKGTGANQDYNMVGNPYPSPVDIGTIVYNAKAAGNITGTAFYVFNPFLGAGGQFQAIPINGTPYYIQANCAFQVRAAHNGDTLNFTENNKNQSATGDLLRAQPEYVSLYIYDANNHPWDMLHVKFSDAATDNEDSKYDAGKPSGTDLNFYSLSADNQKLAIDARPFSADKTIPLGINTIYQQEYTIKAEGVVVPDGGQLYLHDKLLNQSVLLQQGTEYKFSITGNKATQGDNRFELKMVTAADTKIAANGLQVMMVPNPAKDNVTISFTSGKADQVNVRIVDVTGTCVYNKGLGTQTSGAVNVSLNNLANGIYMMELTSGGQKIVKRLIKE